MQTPDNELEFNYRNHTSRHVMIRYVGARFDDTQPPGDRWIRQYAVIFLDDHEDGKVMVAMLDNGPHEIEITYGEYHKLPMVLNGRNITPKNEKDYYQIIHYLEQEYMAEFEVYRNSKDYFALSTGG